jgi:hypothetical protein
LDKWFEEFPSNAHGKETVVPLGLRVMVARKHFSSSCPNCAYTYGKSRIYSGLTWKLVSSYEEIFFLNRYTFTCCIGVQHQSGAYAWLVLTILGLEILLIVVVLAG